MREEKHLNKQEYERELSDGKEKKIASREIISVALEAIGKDVEGKQDNVKREDAQREINLKQLMLEKQRMVPEIQNRSFTNKKSIPQNNNCWKEIIDRQRSAEPYRRMDRDDRIQKTVAYKNDGQSSERYSEGDQILYKDPDNGRWHGPGKIMSTEGRKMRIIHAGYKKNSSSQ